MRNTFAIYFQIFVTFGYKKVKNSESKDSQQDNERDAWSEASCGRYKLALPSGSDWTRHNCRPGSASQPTGQKSKQGTRI